MRAEMKCKDGSSDHGKRNDARMAIDPIARESWAGADQ